MRYSGPAILLLIFFVAVLFSSAAEKAPGVSAQTVAPVIECMWELPRTGSLGENGRTLYEQDDDPFIHPGFPCDRINAVGAKPASEDAVQNVIQLVQSSTGVSETRTVENWVAVGHPDGADAVDEVSWKVLNPDGSLKLEIQGSRVQVQDSSDGSVGDDQTVDLNDLGSPSERGTMLHAAMETGQVSDGAITAPDWGLMDLVIQRQADLWFGSWKLDKDQICGLHTVEVTAVANGVASTLTNTLSVQCMLNLEIDVSQVLWGPIGTAAKKTIPGDLNFVPDDSSKATTARYHGSHPVQIGVQFGTMVEVDEFGVPLRRGRTLNTFGFGFGFERSDLDWFDPVQSGEVSWVNRPEFICSDSTTTGRFDLSVVGHPDQSSIYGGEIQFLVRGAAGCGLEEDTAAADATPEP